MGRDLPDIRTLADDPRRDWQRTRARVVAIALSVIASVLTMWTASITWASRNESTLPDALHAACAVAPVLLTVALLVRPLRRHDNALAAMLAIILPVVTWLAAMCFLLVAAASA